MEVVNLKKGEGIKLCKGDKVVNQLLVGLGWDKTQKGSSVDCDVAGILLDKNNEPVASESLVYYGNLSHSSGGILHKGDNLVGGSVAGADSEQMEICLDKLPNEVHKVVFVVNIFASILTRQHFGNLENAYIRVCDRDSDTELCRYILAENYTGVTGMYAGECLRVGDGWQFKALGEGLVGKSSLNKLRRDYNKTCK